MYSMDVIRDERYNPLQLTPISLPMVKQIKIDSFHLPISWSNKYESLILDRWYGISDKWCNFVIDKCNCRGIEFLRLYDSSFDFSNIAKSTGLSGKELKQEEARLLAKLAVKFKNIKTLEIEFICDNKCDENILIFWGLLESSVKIAMKRVELNISLFDKKCYKTLVNVMENYGIKSLHAVKLGLPSLDINYFDYWKKILLTAIKQKTLQFIDIDNSVGGGAALKEIVQLLRCNDSSDSNNDSTGLSDDSKTNMEVTDVVEEKSSVDSGVRDKEKEVESYDWSSLMVIALTDKGFATTPMNVINESLQTKLVNNNRLCRVYSFTIDFNQNDQNLESSFGIFFKTVYSMIFQDQIPICIRLSTQLNEYLSKNFENYYNKIFLPIFGNKRKLKQLYKAPIEHNSYHTAMFFPDMVLFSLTPDNDFPKFVNLFWGMNALPVSMT